MEPTTREQIRSIDRCAIDTLGIPGVILMENAGRGATDAIEQFLGGLADKSVAIVAGAGNNGGDGFVVTRHVIGRGGRAVVFLVTPAEKISGDAQINLRIIQKLGCDIRDAGGAALGDLAKQLGEFDLVVDAVGGTGIEGALRGDLAAAVEQINAAGVDVVAIDIPTGLDCNTGQVSGPAVRAKMTVTFVARKKGFDSSRAGDYTGEVVVADIGIPADRVAELAAREGQIS